MAQTKGETFKNVVKDMDTSNHNLTHLRYGGTKSDERHSVTTPTAQCITQNSRNLSRGRPGSPGGILSEGSMNPWLDAQLRKTDVNFREINSKTSHNTSRLKIGALKFDHNVTAMTPKLSATEAAQFILSPKSHFESERIKTLRKSRYIEK